MIKSLASRSRWELFAMAGIGCLAAMLLFWDLGGRYLWQDEAATAVLSDRLLRFGRPMAYKNLATREGTHFHVSKKEFCRLLKHATLLTPEDIQKARTQ